MALINSGILTVDQIDFSAETIQHQLYMPALTAGNIVAQTLLEVAYLAALVNISDLNIYKRVFGNISRNSPKNPPTVEEAQREQQWLVQYSDTVTQQLATFRIGGAVLTGNLKPRSDRADLTATDIAAYVAALELLALSAQGNAIIVTDIVHVGKNDRSPKLSG